MGLGTLARGGSLAFLGTLARGGLLRDHGTLFAGGSPGYIDTMRLRRRQYTVRYDQKPRPVKRRDRVFAYTIAGCGAAALAWLLFSAIALHHS